MKGTFSKFDGDVVPLRDDGISEVEQYRPALRNLHSQAVVDAQSNFVPNNYLSTVYTVSNESMVLLPLTSNLTCLTN